MSNSATAWQRPVYERHLDLILAEELECNPAFALWLHLQTLSPDQIPDGEIVRTTVRVSHADNAGHDPRSAGETDLFVESHWSNGQVTRLLVEDKLDAVLQPRQIERYEERLVHHGAQVHAAGGVVVAPASYLTYRESELGNLALVSIESIAQLLRVLASTSSSEARERLLWRSRRLVSMKAESPPAPDHEPTIAVRDWIIGELALRDPAIVPNSRSMRTVNTGWLYFKEPKAILYKLVHGYVDVYFRDIWPDEPDTWARVVEAGDLPDGFESAEDSRKNPLLRACVHERTTTDELVGRGDLGADEGLRKAVEACVEAAAWIRRQTEMPTPGEAP